MLLRNLLRIEMEEVDVAVVTPEGAGTSVEGTVESSL